MTENRPADNPALIRGGSVEEPPSSSPPQVASRTLKRCESAPAAIDPNRPSGPKATREESEPDDGSSSELSPASAASTRSLRRIGSENPKALRRRRSSFRKGGSKYLSPEESPSDKPRTIFADELGVDLEEVNWSIQTVLYDILTFMFCLFLHYSHTAWSKVTTSRWWNPTISWTSISQSPCSESSQSISMALSLL